jgi:hypothetical protein
VWSGLTNTVDSTGGKIQGTSSSTPAGGMVTKKLVKSNGNYVQYTIDTLSNSEAIVLSLCDTNDNNYTWSSSSNLIRIGIFNVGDGIFYTINNTASSAIGTSTTCSNGDIIRMEVSSDNILIRHSTDGGGSFSTIATQTGAFADTSTVFIKCIFAVNSSSKNITVNGLGLI